MLSCLAWFFKEAVLRYLASLKFKIDLLSQLLNFQEFFLRKSCLITNFLCTKCSGERFCNARSSAVLRAALAPRGPVACSRASRAQPPVSGTPAGALLSALSFRNPVNFSAVFRMLGLFWFFRYSQVMLDSWSCANFCLTDS